MYIACYIFYVIFVTGLIALKEDTFNVNDILNEDLMPTYFLDDHKVVDESSAPASQVLGVNGSVDAAFSTLNFHRKMMNEYQCRNYVAEQILEEMGKNVIQRRIGKPFDNVFVRRSQDPRSNLFYDPGSANYQDWLAKVMALNDIHKNHNLSVGSNLSQLESTQPHQRLYEVMETEPDVGLGDSDGLMYDVSKHVGGYEYSMQPPPPPHYHHSSSQHEVHEEYGEERESHGLGIADLFDISLTGIAFLSFGMFILQVLMCITMNHPQTQLMQFVDNGDTVNVDDMFRNKRETENSRSISSLNTVARYALLAIKPQSTACLYRTLCLGNKHARRLPHTSKYWLPLWQKMMNEYQCRNYVAEQILEEMGKNVIQRRIGKPFDNVFVRRSQDPRSNLFFDPGSANYQDWLAKVMALNDIHKNHNLSVGSNLSQLESTQPHQRLYEVMETEPDVGLGDSDGLMYDVSKHVCGYEYSMQPPPPPHFHHSSSQHEVHEEYGEERESHGLGIADLFDISLTGIAFLSFGMFILQVLMCITMNHPQTQLMQFVDNGDTVNVDDMFRNKRETENSRSISSLNSIARYALIAIKPQSTACLYRTLCLGNKHARGLRHTSKYWLPLWHAGVSWVRGGLRGAGVAGALRAAALGLGAADCAQIYAEECN